MSAGDMRRLYGKTGFLEPDAVAEDEGTISEKDIFPQTLPPLMVADGGDTTDRNHSLEENFMLSLDDLSHHRHDPPPHMEDVSATSMDIKHPQHLDLNMGRSPYNNNNNMINNWDATINELQGVDFANNQHEQQEPHDQQVQQTESQNYTLCFTDLIQNTPNFQHSMVFHGDLPIGSEDDNNNTSAYLPPHNPPALGDLYQSLPHRDGFLFGGDGWQHDIGVLEFNNTVTDSVAGRGRDGGKGNKQLPIEKHRREQLNGKFQILRSLIPNPTKVDRASVVGDAIEYIRELVRTVNELKILVEKKRYERERRKRHKTEDGAAESRNMRPYGDSDGCIRTSWLQRKSKDSEVDVYIIDDEVTVKMIQRKKINCLLFVSKVLDELKLDLHHVAGGHVGEYCSFMFNSKITEGSSVYASAIANRVIEVMDTQYAAAVPHTSDYYS